MSLETPTPERSEVVEAQAMPAESVHRSGDQLFRRLEIYNTNWIGGTYMQLTIKRKKKNTIIPGFSLSLGYTMLYLSIIVLLPLSMVFLNTDCCSSTVTSLSFLAETHGKDLNYFES